MRLVWVLPWVHRVGGNKMVLGLAAQAARAGHDVEVWAHTVRADLRSDIDRQLTPARFHALRETTRPYAMYRDALAWSLARGRTLELVRALAASHARSPIDTIMLVSNEATNLGQLLHERLPPPRPLIGRSVMELIDHSFLLRRERPHAALRAALAPTYPVVHWAWGRQLRGYDFLCANSDWTAELLEYLYGVSCDRLLIAIPDETYRSPTAALTRSKTPYVAVPTVSLGRQERRLLSAIVADGLPVVSFGPQPVPGTRHLGFLPEERLGTVLAEAAVTLFLFDYEALGLVPFESLAVGTPVVTQRKHGVHRQWSGHPYVEFGASITDFVAGCRRWLEQPPTVADRVAAIASVEPFRASRVAADFVRFLEGRRGTR